MLFYEKMRLVREENQAVRDNFKIDRKIDRLKKNIDRRTKYFQSLFTKLDQEYKSLQNRTSSDLNNLLGLNGNAINPYSGNYNQLTPFIAKRLMYGCTNVGMRIQTGTDADGKPIYEQNVHKMDPSTYGTIYSEFMRRGGSLNDLYKKDKDGNIDTNNPDNRNYDLFNMMLQSARAQQAEAQQFVQVQAAAHMENLSIWYEAQKADLEAQEDSILDPLQYEQTMLECDKTSVEEKLERIKARKQSVTSALAEASQDAAPKFGLNG